MPSIVISGPTESPHISVLMMSCEVLGLEYEFRKVELESGEDLNLMVIFLCLVIDAQLRMRDSYTNPYETKRIE
jgi:hypothetical protein